MKKKSSLSSVGSMIDSVLARHGIAKQVLASQVVIRGNELLDELLREETRGDMKVLSYKEGIMTLACRHGAALYDAEGLCVTLKRAVEADLPSVTVTVEAKLRPDAFREML